VFFKVLKKCRRKKCHWCQSSDSLNLIKCNNCQKEFFCMDCIKQRLELNLLCLFTLNFEYELDILDIIVCCAYMVILLLDFVLRVHVALLSTCRV
jgi:hypothetical protein